MSGNGCGCISSVSEQPRSALHVMSQSLSDGNGLAARGLRSHSGDRDGTSDTLEEDPALYASAAAELSKIMSGAEVAAASAVQADVGQQSWLAQKMALPLPRGAVAPVRPPVADPSAASRAACLHILSRRGAAGLWLFPWG